MRILLTLAALTGLTASAARADLIAGSAFSYGNWEGAAYTFNGSSEFSHCAISVGFVSGDTLYFGVNSDASVTVGVASNAFRFTPEQSFPVSLFVDRRAPFRATATAVDTTFAVLTIEDFPAAMDAFGRGRSLRMESALATGHYDLTGSFRALEAARQCAIAQLQVAAKGGGAGQPPLEPTAPLPPMGGAQPTAPLPTVNTGSILPPPSGDTRYHGN